MAAKFDFIREQCAEERAFGKLVSIFCKVTGASPFVNRPGPAGDPNRKMWFMAPRSTLDALRFIGSAVRRGISVVGGWNEFQLRQESAYFAPAGLWLILDG
jgi:hypothetical protein